MKLALTFYSVLRMPIADILCIAVEAEKAGFQYITFAESFYRDVSALASAVATKTSKIYIGTSVYPIATRTPFQVAMASATLDEISNGRLGFIGLGVGYKARIEQYFGVKVEKSLAKMREFIEIVRGLLSGESFSYQGKYFSFQEFPALVPKPLNVPILLGTSGPKMLSLAGQIANGVVLNSIGTPEYFKYAIEKISHGAIKAGRNAGKLEIGASLVFSAAERREDALNLARPDILFYLLYPELDPVIQMTPYLEKCKEIRSIHSKDDARKALSMVTDEMVEELSISGTIEDCRKKVKDLTRLGITMPIIRVSVQPLQEIERKEAFLMAIKALSNI